ncbi:hypothetical protein DLAC_08706 [Tieghemostelium lacteum]|uniref:GRAM domain-containing protein n=1 Tax=Tieghemostelium lacteum TaxID=361077 RepID=A0A151Z842_TIELA|nr:hypothetical protein DLAC_08706 [Tieghemostelium lacteum]|eukprot:KYQ90122.1 hypothetical protein DLAC_08706 [Tieghemostelium lacteum]
MSSAQIINENNLLKEQVQSLKNEVQKSKLDMEILNQDRRMLYQETMTLKDEIVRLQATITRLEMMNDKYSKLVQQSNDKLQKTKTDQMAAIQSIRAMSNGEQDKEFRTKFGLPEGEFSIVSYSCTNEALQSGFLHITPLFICFEPHALGILNVITKSQENTISLSLKDIVSLNKVKAIKFLPGKGTCVEIKTRDGVVRLYKHFIKRKECLRNIYNQGLTIGHKIEMLRENEPDIEHLDDSKDDD